MTVHPMELVGTTWAELVVGEYRALVGLTIALVEFARNAKKGEVFLAAQFGEGLEAIGGGHDFLCRKSFEHKGLRELPIRLLFSIGFLDAGDVIQMDARSICARIVRRAETALCAAQRLEGDNR